jgi:hypothetical protein
MPAKKAPKTTKPKVPKPQKATKVLSRDQLQAMLLTPCKTEQQLKNFIHYFFELKLPDVRVSRYADTDPFHMIWELYNICVNKVNPENIQELLYVASRGAGKTLGVAIAELLIILHDQRDTAHVGAILSQAKRCYNYQQKFILNAKMRPILMPHDIPEDMRIVEKTNMEKTVFNINNEKIALEVLPTTLKAVNGFHGPLVVCDELDTISGEGLRAYQDIAGMLDSKGNKRALRVGISTRKSRYGLMNRAMENAAKEGRTVRRWTVLEFSQRCPDDRSGVVPAIGYYNQDKLLVITADEYERSEKSAQQEFLQATFPGEGCLKCPIAALCLGDSKQQTSTSPMLKPIDDAIKKARENGPDWAISQLFNLKPSVEGIIYKEFERKLHSKTWNEMWKILTNTDFPGACTHDMFVKKCRAMKLPVYAGIDWGFSHPSTLVVFYVDSRENIYVVRCDGRTHYSNYNWIHHIRTKWHNSYGINLYFPDLANPGDGQMMREAGLACPDKVEKNVFDGIQVVKKYLRQTASPMPKLFFAEETCAAIMQEFETYHFEMNAAGEITDTPAKENDHWLDALRYALFGLFGKSSMIVSDYQLDFSGDRAMDNYGNYLRPPTATEFAQQNNLKVEDSSMEAVKKLGEVGTLSELNKDEEDELVGGSGNFLWSFN